MMKLNSFMTLVVGSLMLVSTGVVNARCSAIQSITTPIAVGHPVTMENVRTAIVKGGLSKGWTVDSEVPGKVTLIFIKSNVHVAACDVSYNTNEYSITINSKTNLTRDCDSGEVHPKYNQWIRNLNKHIYNNLK